MNKAKLFVLASVVTSTLAVAQENQSSANLVSQPAIPAAPASKAGQCHALVNVPAKLASVIEEIVSQEAGEQLDVTPAEYEWVEKLIPISEEERTIEIIPATYKTVQEQIIVEPERKEFEIIPAQYEEVKEKIVVKPAMRVWRKSRGGAASLTGEVMRLIEVPAEYEVITKNRMVAPPQIREVVKPPETAIIEKKVIDQPATTREIVIPAEHKTIRVKQLVTPPKEVRTATPAKLQKITKQEVVANAQLKWQRVPCDNDLNEANVIAIQEGLRRAGYDITADGKFGKGSQEALEKFQEARGLAKGAITIETMKALGIDID